MSGDVLSLSGAYGYTLNSGVYSFTGTNITASYDTITNPGKLTLSGIDTLVNYQAILRTVTYLSTSDDPTDLKNSHNFNTRTIDWTVTDASSTEASGNLISDAATTTVNITAVNDAPVLTTPTAISLTDTAAADTFSNQTGTLSATDVDTITAFTYGISGSTTADNTKIGRASCRERVSSPV